MTYRTWKLRTVNPSATKSPNLSIKMSIISPHFSKQRTSFLSLPRELRHQILLDIHYQTAVLPAEKWLKSGRGRKLDRGDRLLLCLWEQKRQENQLRDQLHAVRIALQSKRERTCLLPSWRTLNRRRKLEYQILIEDLEWVGDNLKAKIETFWSGVFHDVFTCGRWEKLWWTCIWSIVGCGMNDGPGSLKEMFDSFLMTLWMEGQAFES
jgi:hypothetical protein